MAGTFVRANFVAAAACDSFIGRSIVTDAYVYDGDRETIHAVVLIPAPSSAWSLRLTLHADPDSGPLAGATLQPTAADVPKAEVVIAAAALAAGRYAVRAALLDGSGGQLDLLERIFELRSSTTRARGRSRRAEIPLLVEHCPGPSVRSWAISTAVPLPRGLVRDEDQLELLEDRHAIAAQFHRTAIWSPDGSIRWVAVAFIAHYRNGEPRRYVIRVSRTARARPTSENVASDNGDQLVLRSSDRRFLVHKGAFAGAVPDDVEGPPTGGPYVVDEGGQRYEARHHPPDSVTLVENGPVSATVLVKGWYASAPGSGQTRLCRYVTQITAFADSPILRISHRTVLTDLTRLSDVGWTIPLSFAGNARFGIDGITHRVSSQSGHGAFVHQDRHDRCWLVSTTGAQIDRLGPMRRADGHLAVTRGGSGKGIAVLVRDIWQKFPKELGVTWANGGAEVSLHFWPRHGHRAFGLKSTPPDPVQDELDRNNIHKLWYAHQGALLDLKMPDDRVTWLCAFVPPPTDENGIGDNAVLNARDAKAIGVAFGTEFGVIYGHVPDDAGLASVAHVFQLDPHAIAEPEWSAGTGVEGRWAARDVAGHPRAERAIENGMEALASAISDVSGEYGMWIHADVHDLWLPHRGDPREWGVPQLHRVWQGSHYRNVWACWFLYLRSGLPALRLWARATSDHYLNVRTVHSVDPTTPTGKHVGDMYHCYSTTPWGGESDLWAHYVDPDAHRLRGLLQHDLYALEMYRTWFASSLALDPGRLGGGREAVNTLGLVVSYYAHVQDANALLLLDRIADQIFSYYWDATQQRFDPTRNANPRDHPVWHRQAYQLYHALTQDPRAVQFATDWLALGQVGAGSSSVSAFAYFATGSAAHLSRAVPDVHDHALLYHDAPGDRYHGYGPGAVANYDGYFFQETPYFLRAMNEAGISESEEGARRECYPSVHWGVEGLAVRAFVLVPAGAGGFDIRLEAVRHRNDVPKGRCIVYRWSADTAAWTQENDVSYPVDPGTRIVPVAPADAETLYRIDIISGEAEFLAPYTTFPEVIEVRRMYWNGAEWLYTTHGWSRQSFWLDWKADPSFPTAEVGVAGESSGGYYNRPAFVRLRSDGGYVAFEGTVFAWAQTRDRVPLAGLREVKRTLGDPRPWQLYSVALAGPMLRLWDGPPRMFVAVDRAHLATVLPQIPEEPPGS